MSDAAQQRQNRVMHAVDELFEDTSITDDERREILAHVASVVNPVVGISTEPHVEVASGEDQAPEQPKAGDSSQVPDPKPAA